MDLSVIDISQIDNAQSQPAIAKQVTDACKDWGFLLVKGQTIPAADIEEMFTLGKEFFDLPEDHKAPWPITESQIGYMGSFRDRLEDDKMSMWFGGTPGTLAKNSEQLPPFWREHATKIEAFKHQCHELVLKLLVCFAIAMDLPDRNFFANAHQEHVGRGNSLRMLMYPARDAMPKDVGSRMGQHTDSGSVTLLFQKSPGLEVMSPSGNWVKAPCIEGTILVNIGDALSFWSGNLLKATLHRVTFDGLPHDKERQTMAYFGAANSDTVLQPLLQGRVMEKYYTNGFEVEPGITVGELNAMIMKQIYGPTTKTEEGDGLALHPQASKSVKV